VRAVTLGKSGMNTTTFDISRLLANSLLALGSMNVPCSRVIMLIGSRPLTEGPSWHRSSDGAKRRPPTLKQQDG
jgi:hypothetical protein